MYNSCVPIRILMKNVEKNCINEILCDFDENEVIFYTGFVIFNGQNMQIFVDEGRVELERGTIYL